MRIVKFFYKWLYWLVPWWYGLTMTLTRKRRYPDLPYYRTVYDVSRALSLGRRWRPDPLGGKLDVLSHPRKVQWKMDRGNGGIGDCDDHAIYWATAILQNNLAQRVYLGTVWAKRPSDKRGFGHVVCVWDDGRDIYWGDYFAPSRTLGIWSWAHDYSLQTQSVVHAAGLIEVKLRRSGEPKLCKRTQRIVL